MSALPDQPRRGGNWANLTPEQYAERRRRMSEGHKRARAAAGRKARVLEEPLSGPVPAAAATAPILAPVKRPVSALVVKWAGAATMARAASILEAGLAAAQQAIAVQLETADGALNVAELALAFVKADAKARGTCDALVALRKAALAWDQARGGAKP